MSSLTDRIAGLTPEKRELLLRKLNASSSASASGKTSEPRPRNLIPEAPRDRERFPLSFAQQRYWFLDQLEPGNPAYNIHFPLAIHEAVDRAALEHAIDTLFQRHEALRTRFSLVDGEPVQSIRPAGSEPFSLLQRSVTEEEASRRASEHAATPFDLASGSLLRVELLKIGESHFVVLLTTHHIVCDRWSLRILVREMLELYSAFKEGRESPLPPLERQYLDYTLWQRDYLMGAVLESHLAFWREQLSGPLPVLELPTDHPRPPLQTFRGATRTRWLGKALKDDLRFLGQSERATLFMTVLAAFQLLLYRYTGERDVIVGSPVAGRTRPEVESIVGFFANTLVLRTDIEPAESFRELLRRVRRTALDAYSHQELPFEKLVEELRPERNLGQNPLFQVLLTFQPASLPARGELVTKLGLLPMESRTAQFDLSLYLDDTSSGLVATMEFNTDLFEPPTIERMLTHFENLLTEVVRAPDRALGEVTMLSEAERRTVIGDWNDTASPEDAAHGSSVPQRFEAQARRAPDARALAFGETRLSYAELDARSNRLAHWLAARRVGAETVVGICASPSVELVVGLLAVLKTGAAYLPLDPAFPPSRLAFMLEDSGAPIVLTREEDASALPMSDALTVALDTESVVSALTREPWEAPPPRQLETGNLAYLIYTSGSTGRPKGVQVPHGALANLLSDMETRTAIESADVLVSLTTISFDIAGLELFLPLVSGASLVLVSRDEARDGHALVARLAEHGATLVQATPASWRLMLEAGFGAEEGRDVRVLCGGEALPPDLARALVEHSSRVWNVYGPTETTIWSTAQLLSRGAPVTLGRPVANTVIYVLDRDLIPVPSGVPGEIYIGGAGVTRGYYGRPDLTAERFLADPFASSPGRRMYRTGDLGRFVENGELEYLGRNDFQVKVRGFRIELGEIEEALIAVEGVKMAVASAQHGDGASDTRLIAHIVMEPDKAPTVTELRNALKQKLPAYMVPSSFVSLDAFPLTPNGKIDRLALARSESRGVAGEAIAPPRTEMEERVAAIWRDVLKLERVGRHDNFFDLGGHSLLSMKVIARLEEAIGERVNPRELIFQTLEQFAAACEAQTRRDRDEAGHGLVGRLMGRLKGLAPRMR